MSTHCPEQPQDRTGRMDRQTAALALLQIVETAPANQAMPAIASITVPSDRDAEVAWRSAVA